MSKDGKEEEEGEKDIEELKKEKEKNLEENKLEKEK